MTTTTYADIIKTDRYRELCALCTDDGTGTLGTIVAQALIDNPDTTAADIEAIIAEATADARLERERA